jgi:hypothetical protein
MLPGVSPAGKLGAAHKKTDGFAAIIPLDEIQAEIFGCVATVHVSDDGLTSAVSTDTLAPTDYRL